MKIIMSPSKGFRKVADYGAWNNNGPKDVKKDIEMPLSSEPMFLEDAKMINKILVEMSPEELTALFKCSKKKLSETVKQIRFWEDAKTSAALLAFSGVAFKSLHASTMSVEDLEYACENLSIFSGLYGVLKPQDLIAPYRLDFNDSLKIGEQTITGFWKEKVQAYFESILEPNEFIVNLASKEYSSIIAKDANMITLHFRDMVDEEYTTSSVYGKKARGAFCEAIIKAKITNIEDIKELDVDDYYYEEDLSDANNWFFVRERD